MKDNFILEKMEENRDREAVVSPEGRVPYGDLLDRTQGCLMDLDSYSIREGSVAAIVADFSADSIAMLLALIMRGCVVVPISRTILDKEKYRTIAQCQFVMDIGGGMKSIEPTGMEVTHEMLLAFRRERIPGLILFSSGTTGEPKAALHDLNCLLEKFKRPGKSLKTISFLLFDHIGGFNTLIHTLSHGGTIVTIPDRRPEQVCAIIEKEQVELLPTTPSFLNMILLNKLYEKYNLSYLKIITYGTESMPEYTLKLFSRILPDTVFKQTYGLSEMGIMATKSESSDSLWMKVGGEGFETKVVDGILFIRGESAMKGYLNAPSPFDQEGWFDTKDRVEEKDGYLRILGRTTDLINVGGEKVYPIEIENKLLQIDGVLDARVFGEKNPIMGNTVAAEILVDPENNNNEFRRILRQYCGENLEKYKRPSRFLLSEKELYGDRLKKRR